LWHCYLLLLSHSNLYSTTFLGIFYSFCGTLIIYIKKAGTCCRQRQPGSKHG
jgi:hypothetical protein